MLYTNVALKSSSWYTKVNFKNTKTSYLYKKGRENNGSMWCKQLVEKMDQGLEINPEDCWATGQKEGIGQKKREGIETERHW